MHQSYFLIFVKKNFSVRLLSVIDTCLIYLVYLQAGRLADRQTSRLADKQPYAKTNRLTDRHVDRQLQKQTLTDRHVGRQLQKQTLTDRHVDRQL